MGMLSYLKNSVWDFLLCIVASCGLSFTLCSGFYATQVYQGEPYIIFAGCIVLTLALFLVAYNFTTATVGGVILALICIGVLFFCFSTSSVTSAFDDEAGNRLLLGIMIILPTVLVFLLSRKKLSAIILLAIGVVACAIIEYLYWYGHIVAFLAFALSALALVAYRTYANSLRNSDSEKLAFGTVSVSAVVLVALALALGCGVYFAVIAPLNPPNTVVKLITEHVRVDEKYLKGTGNSVNVENPNLFSTNTNGETTQQEEDDEQEDVQQNMDNTSPSKDEETIEDAGSALNLDERMDKDLDSYNLNPPDWFFLVLPIGIVVLIIAIIVGRKLLRKSRYNKIAALSGSAQARAFFLFFMKRFRKMKVPAPQTQTLGEYMVAQAEVFNRFEQTTGGNNFTTLANTYSACTYGNAEPTEEQLDAFRSYYASFYKNARKFVGSIKYLPMFFRI